MTIFNDYAIYYDLIYHDKKYEEEAKFVHHLVQTHTPEAQSLLELGCGTGRHAIALATYGYYVHGIDVSPQMLDLYQRNRVGLSDELLEKLAYQQGDIRTIHLNKKFDVVLSLFHVFSYQVTNQDLESTIATAREHLNPNGILIFDCWYGPAVLSDRPTTRVKRFSNDEVELIRISESEMHPNQNRVDVHFQMLFKDKTTSSLKETTETHQMRYFFTPELELLLQQNQFSILESAEWMTGKKLGFDTWNAYFVAKAI